MIREGRSAILGLLVFGCCLAFMSASGEARSMKHVVVWGEPGRFGGWPANNGVWIWGNEIVVGFSRGYYDKKSDEHSISRNQGEVPALARSKDGGETWAVEDHPELNDSVAKPYAGEMDFSHPDFALRCGKNYFHVSYNRGRTWKGPYNLPDFGKGLKLTARTDYIVGGKNNAILFLSAEVPGIQAGSYRDRAFCARTTDGGRTFEFISWITDEPRAVRSVMPSTVRVSATELVTALRRRLDPQGGPRNEINWIDAYGSDDNGASWKWLSRVAFTDLGRRNGNPPSLVHLRDGRLCVTYGFRAIPYGVRAKISSDKGLTWGQEIILREDGVTWDLGYPRSVVRPDGKIVTIYYFNALHRREQHIAATLWDQK